MRASRIRTRSLVFLAGVSLAAAAVLGLPASSYAATQNVIPNPGFENGTTTPDQWSHLDSFSISRDTVVKHTGAASLFTSGNDSASNPGAISDCVTDITAGTLNHAISFWYLISGSPAAITGIGLEVDYYTNATCSGSASTGSNLEVTPTADGNWHQVQDNFNSPAGVVAARFVVFITCGFCDQTISANFDDLDYEDTVLAATLVSFGATRAHDGVVVRWRTGTEANELGFNVYRQVGARRVRVNKRILPALGQMAGARYSYVDRLAPRHKAVRYWLQDIDVRGSRTWHGPVRVPAA